MSARLIAAMDADELAQLEPVLAAASISLEGALVLLETGGRPPLLSFLKTHGVTKLSQRQAHANALCRAV